MFVVPRKGRANGKTDVLTGYGGFNVSENAVHVSGAPLAEGRLFR